MADVFLSYAHSDLGRVELLAQAFEDAGLSVWWDHHLQSGAEFSADIESAIAEAGHVVVAWSQAAAKSRWVRDEASEAADQGKLVSLSLDGTPPPMGFRQYHATDMSNWRSGALPEALLQALGASGTGRVPAKVAGKPKSSVRPGLVAAVLAAFLVVGAAAWWAMSETGSAEGHAQMQPEDMKLVAVLPFVAGSSGEDDQYFADGVSEEILNRLDALPEIRVIPRTTSFSYRNTEKSLQAIAEELEVGHIVEGSMRRSGDDVRVTARLVRTGDNQSLWSNSYDVSTDDVFKVQADIAESVASALDVLLDDAKKAEMARAGVDNPEAYAMYARGFDLMDKAHNPDFSSAGFYESLIQAAAVLDRSVEMEPKLWMAPVWSADLEAHILIDIAGGGDVVGVPPELMSGASESLGRKLNLALDGARRPKDRLYVRNFLQAFSDDWSSLLRESEEIWQLRGVCDMPNWTGFLSLSQGQASEVFDFLDAARSCSGQKATFATYLAYGGMWSGRLAEAEKAIRELKPERGETRALQSLAEVLAAQGRKDEVRQIISNLNRGSTPQSLLLMIGDRSQFSHADALEVRRTGRPQAGIRWLALAGERDLANDWAAEIDKHPAGPTVLQIIVDECVCGAPFDLEYTPRYAQRLKRAGGRWPPKLAFEWPLKDW